MDPSWTWKKCHTYCFDTLLVEGDFDVEVFQVVVGGLLLRASAFLMHGLAPAAVHLVILLCVVLLISALERCHLLLHALHLLGLLSCVLLLDCALLGLILRCLLLLALISSHSLLLLVLLLTALVVVLLVACASTVVVSHACVSTLTLTIMLLLIKL